MFVLVASLLCGCSPFAMDPQPGPDKQAVGTWYGAAVGAGSGAVTGAQLAVGAGPAAWVGAGFGGLFGLFSGLGIDLIEEDELRRMEAGQAAREKAWAQRILADHYAHRLQISPSRDIYPADIFFQGDEARLRPDAKILLREIAALTKTRMPWSRIMIASYATSEDAASPYAKFLTERRAQVIAAQFVKSGVEARRLVAQGIILTEPLVDDPDDSPGRYRQAVEIIPLDY